LTLHIDICKPVRQVALPAVDVASITSSCGICFETEAVFTCDIVTLTFDLFTSKWVTGHLCYGLPSCQFSTCCALPRFST